MPKRKSSEKAFDRSQDMYREHEAVTAICPDMVGRLHVIALMVGVERTDTERLSDYVQRIAAAVAHKICGAQSDDDDEAGELLEQFDWDHIMRTPQ